jgi:hypothetical protein
MSKKNWWYVILGIIPAYGANNSLRQFGEPWSGLAAGVIVAAILFGIVKAIQFLIRKVKGKASADES